MEEVQVKWDGFDSSIKNGFQKLSREQLLFDMSISVEGHTFQAHQVILGSISPFLLDLLVNARLVGTPHYPILVLRGISPQDMKLILEFVYNGKVTVPEDQLMSFLSTADQLQIQGLCKKLAGIDLNLQIDDEICVTKDTTSDSFTATKIKNKKRKLNDSTVNIPVKENKTDLVYKCDKCTKSFDKRLLFLRHEKEHLDFRPYVCSVCDQKFKRKEHCLRHVATVHDEMDPDGSVVEINLEEVLDAVESAKESENNQSVKDDIEQCILLN